MEITQEVFLSLFSDDIIRKQYLEIIVAIENKVDKIWRFIVEKSGRKIYWWTFDNGQDDGFFDPERYSSIIGLESNDTRSSLEGYEYNRSFPTSFLWEDYETIVIKHIQTAKDITESKKAVRKQQKQELKDKKESLVASIKSKLTDEELKIITFKKI